MRISPLVVPAASGLVALASAFAAGTPSVYPAPQSLRLLDGTLTLSATTALIGADTADADAVRALRERLALGASAGNVTAVRIGRVGDAAVAGYDSGVAEKSGAYRIVAEKGVIALVGRDDRGVCYAVRTLAQLLDADGSAADLPACAVNDFPLIPRRGIVEGFYGIPDDCWNHAGRLSLIAFCGRHKMDTYIYGPKDDPFHRSRWREPYPQAESERIRELVVASRAAKVDFVWAIHPGGDIRWTEADYLAAKSKFEDMYRIGVRSFAVFFDDIGGEGTKAVRQAELLNRLHREFVLPKGDVTPLILCPTEYNRAWADKKPGGYLDILGAELEPSVLVMWTGNTVVADLDRESMEYINGRLRRPAYIWWNAPCNDFCRTNLSLGPAYGDTAARPRAEREAASALGQRIFGNSAEAAALMSGFTANPMGRSEASKVSLYGVAGYCWNPVAYDADAAWRAAVRELVPGAADAFQTFCEHNRDNGPNGHGYRRPESVAIRPEAEAYLAAFKAGERPDAPALRAEFSRIAAAPAAIRAGAGNPELLREIGPWLDSFAHFGAAGDNALAAAAATDPAARWTAFVRASRARLAQAEVSRTCNRNPWQPGVKVASLVLAPMVDEVMRSLDSAQWRTAAGRPVLTPKGVSGRGAPKSLERMLDADETTWFHEPRPQVAGDWYGVDMGATDEVSAVSLVMGRKDGDRDIVRKGRLEYSVDGLSWMPLGEPAGGEAVFWEGRPVVARFVRYRVLESAGTGVAFRSFDINPTEARPRVLTSVPNLAAIPVRKDKDRFALTPQLEVFRFETGASLGIAFPAPVTLRGLEADLASAGLAAWAKVEVSEDGERWREVPCKAKGDTGVVVEAGGPVRAVRLSNAGKPAEVRIAAFRLRVAEAGALASPFADGRLETFGPLGARQAFAIPDDAVAATLFLGEGSGKSVVVGVASERAGAPGAQVPAGGDRCEYALTGGGKWLILSSSDPAATLHEVVWRRR